MPDEPRRVGDKLVEISLTGCLIPSLANRQPVLLRMHGSNDLFLPVFSTHEKLVAGMALANTPYDRIQEIQDGAEFLASLEENTVVIRVIVDPYKHESGTTRFLEVFAPTS